MRQDKDIILAVDYHSRNIEFRWLNLDGGEERTGNYPTTRAGILRHVEQAISELSPGGRVVWIMESTTGWARVKDLLGERVDFVLANVLQMPQSPKGRRRKSDKIDTGRLLNEYLKGDLPRSFQPAVWWRQVRRLVDSRQDLVERQTAIKNWITSLLHHETWEDRTNLWTNKGRLRLAKMAFSPSDRMLVDLKLRQLDEIDEQIKAVETAMKEVYDTWPEAQLVDQIKGIGMMTAVSILAHIGPISRFMTAEQLLTYAGLIPATWSSDATCHHGHIGGGGTDSHLRYLMIEAATWLAKIPRYRAAYERVCKKRGKKIARIVVARMAMRSIFKILKDKVRFDASASAGKEPARDCRRATPSEGNDAFIALGLPAEKEKARMSSEPSPLCSRQAGARVARQRCPILQPGR